jgi:protease II
MAPKLYHVIAQVFVDVATTMLDETIPQQLGRMGEIQTLKDIIII